MSKALTKAVVLLVVALVSLVAPGTTSAASAATRPVVSSVQPGAGPLSSSLVTITGRNLSRVNAVVFGTRSGTSIQRVSATRIKVMTPRGASAGAVSVRVRVGRTWSTLTRAGRYTFVPRPTVTRISRASGSFAGGDSLTLSGTALSTTASVTIGGAPATVVSKASGQVVVRTPAGVPGAARVSVTTVGGTTSGSTPTFTYVVPTPKDASTLTPDAGTMTSGPVQWVTGGLDPDTGVTDPWVVSLPPNTQTPTVGQAYLLPPGDPAFPSGLTGTVTDVAAQLDDSIRVTIAPTDLDESMSTVDVAYDGPVVDPEASAGSAGAEQRSAPDPTGEVGQASQFSIPGPTALRCEDEDDGTEVGFSANLSLSVTNVRVSQRLRAGSLFSRPSYQGAMTAEFATTGKISVQASATCKLRPTWQNAQRRVIPVGTSGLTVSFAPTMTLKVSAQGTWSVVDKTQATFSVSAELGRTPTYSRSTRSIESRQGGAGTLQLEVAGGASVQFGLLDRAGLQGKVEVGASAALTAAEGNVCVDGELFARLSVGVFLDAFVARWEADAFTVKLSLRALHGCLLAESSPPPSGAAITSARLPDARVGSPYSEYLTTADDRAGSWSVIRGSLPPGLGLDPSSGEISGTPTGPVTDVAFDVRFAGNTGGTSSTTVRLRVQPSTAIGGGDLQFTLRWNGPADLDLHVTDPNGEEVYYSNKVAESGGSLDHDANAACNGADDVNPVENIYWPQGSAPSGDYAAQVVTYAECGGSLEWSLVVRRQGVVVLSRTGSGTSDLFHVVQGIGGASRVAPSTTPASPGRWPVKP